MELSGLPSSLRSADEIILLSVVCEKEAGSCRHVHCGTPLFNSLCTASNGRASRESNHEGGKRWQRL